MVTSESRVLEIGCGTGRFISIPLGYLGASILGIDKHLLSIQHAKRNNPHPNVSFVCASGEDFKSKDRFNLIICNHVLEHLSDPLKMLQNVKVLLEPDGKVFVGIPNGYGWFEIENLIPRMLATTQVGKRIESYLGGQKLRESLNPDSPHVQFFTIKKFAELARQSGLEICWRINREIASGPISNRTILRVPTLARWNVDKAERIPPCLVTAWIFLLKHANE